MSELESETEDVPHSKRERMKLFLKDGLSRGKDELLKGKLKLEHSLGLGHKPNVIPPGEPVIHGEQRTVEIGWHPVAGLAGKWFAEQTGLGKMITEKVHKYPDPTQHWAVLVGDYCHELWMDEHLDVIYINEKINREEWHTYEVGKTRFNDEALRQASEMVIYNMRQKRPAYNLISNNCQTFALLLVDAIQVGYHHQFATSFAVYQRAIGAGSVSELFAERPPPGGEAEEAEEVQVAEEQAAAHQKLGIMDFAKKLMDEHTTKLDNHHSLF
ncbi:hypothetical protein VTK73DRAFT_7367 [Phialemonium thermophilum]|uniref:PPPDE domain-containing protein n=1 Tax=Phialemonium thermophilum TaxID=223376 RepID=A0ABR3WF40_9PEZI